MEQELNNLSIQFDEIISELKKSEEYNDYVKAKLILENCVEANDILNNIKDLQKARNNCRAAKEKKLVEELSNQIENLHIKYDKIFEVSQFNYAYEKFFKKVEAIKTAIENQIN